MSRVAGAGRGLLIALTGVAVAFVIALLTTGNSGPVRPPSTPPSLPAAETGSASCVQSAPGRCDGERAPKVAAKKKRIPLTQQAERVARSYVVASGTFTGNRRDYRRNLRRLLADTSPGAGAAKDLRRMRARVVSSEVQYANEMGAVVLVSGEQTIGGHTFLVNTNVTLVRLAGRYKVEDAQLLGGDAGR